MTEDLESRYLIVFFFSKVSIYVFDYFENIWF
jgi:hypothetical protein